MKAFLRWMAKVIGSAVTVILVVVLFPFISRIADTLLPDESGAAIRTSAVLASRMETSTQLVTMSVEEDGVLHYDVQAAFIGTVAEVNVSYTYKGTFGIDLSDVKMQVAGNEIIFFLPQPGLIQDSLTPLEVYKKDFWYTGFTLTDYERLLESERIARRNAYLSGEASEQLWDATLEAFENTISTWLKDVNRNLTMTYRKAESIP